MLASAHPQLEPLVPALSPPALDSVGDKLHPQSLSRAIRAAGDPYRDYLRVRMPRFPLSDQEVDMLAARLAALDRVPEEAARQREPLEPPGTASLHLTGSRLVTADGFGCTSCHPVGSALPSKAPLNARGPQLSQLGQRIRREWFDRFLNNPPRLIPRMEMPAVKVAVRGVLDDDVTQQLAALWAALNQPGFQPPQPDPVRVARQSGLEPQARAIAITDVVRYADRVFVKPLLIGLGNRHNLLFDLEHSALSVWSLGDTAQQQTEGKTWYWEHSGTPLLAMGPDVSELALVQPGGVLAPQRTGQFLTEVDWWSHVDGGLRFAQRLRYQPPDQSAVTLHVEQDFRGWQTEAASGFVRALRIDGVPVGASLWLRVAAPDDANAERVSDDGRRLALGGGGAVQLLRPGDAGFDERGGILLRTIDVRPMHVELRYTTELATDRFPVSQAVLPQPVPATLDVVPGFEAVRLPIAEDLMPTALDWRPNGQLVVASLKGRVWLADDSNGDGLEDRLWPFSDELAAPYGLATTATYIDVINKYALLRLFDVDGDGAADRTVTVASGWGHTADYHDWAVGLPRDGRGGYYVALPCQQDERAPEAAVLRGHLLRLVPRRPTEDNPLSYALETVTRGHRFPMGLALRRDGELFVTDNQGNYNPFNELNHIVAGAHYGFINALQRQDKAVAAGAAPPLMPPAIDVPHPWTRSVNGICFLETPPAVRQALGRDLFGPFEGQLIGCEYDTRRLIRMSLQRVDATYQGAAYPLSYDEPRGGPPLLGPLVCAVAPNGDLYIGGIRDSGWGGANNIGEIVRLRLQPDQLPCGIAEVRAVPEGALHLGGRPGYCRRAGLVSLDVLHARLDARVRRARRRSARGVCPVGAACSESSRGDSRVG
jgi:glucose/arabinose dehydrogenase